MGRPRLLPAPNDIAEAFFATGSIRGSAKANQCARSVVVRTLERLGIAIPDREEGYRRSRLLQSSSSSTRTVIAETVSWGKPNARFGTTVITVVDEVTFEPCIWPTCSSDADAGVLCAQHASFLAESAGPLCAWPTCSQDRTDASTCYYHGRRVRGELA